MCNNGCIMPEDGFLQGLRDLCDRYQITLIFDEVITGFRTSLGGAQQYFRVTPDLSIFAKAMASGYPISAIVGRKGWMDLIADGSVIHAGTMNSGNPSVAAAIATIELLEAEGVYEKMYRLGKRLMKGLEDCSARYHQDLLVQGLGPMFHSGFTNLTRVKDYRDVLTYDKVKLGKFIAGMHDEGIRVIGRGLWYMSIVHSEEDIDTAIDVADRVLRKL
jgi:glutamate-1-semialdehyde 2,1-aminomutase